MERMPRVYSSGGPPGVSVTGLKYPYDANSCFSDQSGDWPAGKRFLPSVAQPGLAASRCRYRPDCHPRDQPAARTEQRKGADGKKEIAVFIEDKIDEAIRNGRLDRAQAETYGSRRMTKRV